MAINTPSDSSLNSRIGANNNKNALAIKIKYTYSTFCMLCSKVLEFWKSRNRRIKLKREKFPL